MEASQTNIAMKPKIYLETTIISYLSARPSRDIVVIAHQQITQEWWDRHRHNFDLYVSQLVVQEARAGDAEAAERRLKMLTEFALLELNNQALQLAHSLVEKSALPQSAVEDALHIALATVHGMDYLLTWNCRHIANAATRNRIVKLCRYKGYEPPTICTPEELLGD